MRFTLFLLVLSVSASCITEKPNHTDAAVSTNDAGVVVVTNDAGVVVVINDAGVVIPTDDAGYIGRLAPLS